MSWVAGVGRRCRRRRSRKSETTVGRDARLAVRIAVSWVASVGGGAGCCRSHERECSVGRDTLNSLRIGMGRVAGILRGSGLTSHRTGESTSGGRGQREDEVAVHVGMRLMSRVEEDVGVSSKIGVSSVCCCLVMRVDVSE
jgi:hypothetical protein